MLRVVLKNESVLKVNSSAAISIINLTIIRPFDITEQSKSIKVNHMPKKAAIPLADDRVFLAIKKT